MITESLSTLKIHKLTQEQYNRELENGNIDETALYLTPDEDNNNGSPWDEQSEMLFSTGLVRINNVIDTEGSEHEAGTIKIGNATENTEGNSVIISQSNICFDGLAYSDMSSTLNRFGLQLVKESKNIGITGDGITYNNQLLSWERIIAAVEAIENAVDVSEVGQ